MKEKNNIGESWNNIFNKDSYKISMLEVKKVTHSFHVKFITKYAKPPSKILEAGCGSARFSLALALKSYDVTAMDYSKHIVKNVKSLSKKIKNSYPDIRFNCILGDISKMPFKEESFSIVFNEGVVEHWLNDKERINIIKEMTRVTKINGYIIIIVPNGKHPYIDKWEKKGLMSFKLAPPMINYDSIRLRKDMKAAGLKVIKTDGINPWNSIGHYPYSLPLLILAWFLNRLPLLNRSLREKWGIDLIIIGQKIKSDKI